MEKRSPEISILQQETEEWKTDIVFCRDEIKILNRYLQQIRDKNTVGDMSHDLADFQLKLSEKIVFAHEMMNAVVLHNEQLIHSSLNLESLLDNHSRLQEKVKDFYKDYTTLKSVFVRFLAKADIII